MIQPRHSPHLGCRGRRELSGFFTPACPRALSRPPAPLCWENKREANPSLCAPAMSRPPRACPSRPLRRCSARASSASPRSGVVRGGLVLRCFESFGAFRGGAGEAFPLHARAPHGSAQSGLRCHLDRSCAVIVARAPRVPVPPAGAGEAAQGPQPSTPDDEGPAGAGSLDRPGVRERRVGGQGGRGCVSPDSAQSALSRLVSGPELVWPTRSKATSRHDAVATACIVAKGRQVYSPASKVQADLVDPEGPVLVNVELNAGLVAYLRT